MALLICSFCSRLSSALWHEESNSRGGKNKIEIPPAMKISLGPPMPPYVASFPGDNFNGVWGYLVALICLVNDGFPLRLCPIYPSISTPSEHLCGHRQRHE